MALTPQELAAMIVYEANQMGINVPTSDLIQMVSIPSRESSYDPFAHNPNTSTGDDSYGLYQINMLGSLGPSRARALGISNYAQLYDPWVNVKAMLQLYVAAGNKLTAWGGYKGMANDFNVSQAAKNAAATAVSSVQAAAASGTLTSPDLSRFAGQFSSATGGLQLTPAPSGAQVQLFDQSGALSASSGGGSTGGTGTGSLTDLFGAPATSVDAATLANQLYPYLSAYLNDPTIGPIIKQAADQGWSTDRLAGALSATPWWQSTSSTARQFDALQNTDPATANAQIEAAADSIGAEAAQLGLTIDAGRLNDIAKQSVRLGWNDAQTRQVLGAEAQRNPAEIAATQLATLRSMASDYAVKYNDPDLQKWAANIIGGTATNQQFQSELIGKAQAMFPTISDALAKGQTVKQYMDPYLQEMGTLLEVNPDQIDLTDPKYTAVLMGSDAKGNRAPMSLSDAATYVRQTSSFNWGDTQNAQQQGADFALRLGTMFGKTTS